MYCPEDGAHIPYKAKGECGNQLHYAPCPECTTSWVYDRELGVYLPYQNLPQLAFDGIVDAVRAVGEEHRRLGEDVRTAHILDTLERQASEEGKAEYLFGEHSLVVKKNNPATQVYEPYIYIEHESIGWMAVTRDRALQMLAERKHHDRR